MNTNCFERWWSWEYLRAHCILPEVSLCAPVSWEYWTFKKVAWQKNLLWLGFIQSKCPHSHPEKQNKQIQLAQVYVYNCIIYIYIYQYVYLYISNIYIYTPNICIYISCHIYIYKYSMVISPGFHLLQNPHFRMAPSRISWRERSWLFKGAVDEKTRAGRLISGDIYIYIYYYQHYHHYFHYYIIIVFLSWSLPLLLVSFWWYIYI